MKKNHSLFSCRRSSYFGAVLLVGLASAAAAETIGPLPTTVTPGVVTVMTPMVGNNNFAGTDPSLNPNQVTITSTITSTGVAVLTSNFEPNPATEYGMGWTITNNSGAAWTSMQFTIQFAPLSTLAIDFDADVFDTQPNSSALTLNNWGASSILFDGGSVPDSTSGVFNVPLDLRGNCCSGSFIVFAIPNAPVPVPVPEPSTGYLILLGAASLAVGACWRSRRQCRFAAELLVGALYPWLPSRVSYLYSRDNHPRVV